MPPADSPEKFSTGLQHAAVTDVGMRRATNQDSHSFVVADNLLQWQTRGHLFVVADGMGAHAAGELASKMAAEGVPHRYHKHTELSPPEALKLAMEETNSAIHDRGEANAEFHQMGTTCSAIVLLPQGAVVGHVGDSRVYRARGGKIEQLSFDHSLQWELRASGKLPKGFEESAAVPKNVITRSMGPSPRVQVDLEGPLPIELNDQYLLCSDGLTGKVEDDEIGVILNSLPPEEAARLLVDLANLRGGPDNITVLIARVTSEAITTAVARAEPIRMGAVTKPGKVPVVMLTIVGVAILTAIVLVLLAYYIPAGVVAIIAGIGGLIAWVQSKGSTNGGMILGRGHRLGKGPYASVSAIPSTQVVEKLQTMSEELRDATEDGGWEIDLKPFEEQLKLAKAAMAKGQVPAAVQGLGRAISYMMAQLRKQSIRGGDSWIQF